MSKFALVDASGNPIFTVEAEGYTDGAVYGALTARSLPLNAVDQEVLSTWYWKGMWKTRIPRPDQIVVWNNTTEVWEDQRTVAQLQAALVVRLREKRDALLFGGLTWDGSVFDSDAEVSQPRLLGAFTTVIAGGWPSGGVAWRLKDNSWRTLSATDVQNLWGAFQTRMLSLFAAFATHEATVNAETDISVLRSYDTEAGWPS